MRRDKLLQYDPVQEGCITSEYIQGWAKEWSLGCVNSPPAARESQEAGFTQPRVHFLAHPCMVWSQRLECYVDFGVELLS